MRRPIAIWSALALLLALVAPQCEGRRRREAEPQQGRPDHHHRQHPGRADAVLRQLRDAAPQPVPRPELVVHNLGWSADELTLRPRSKGFKDHGHTLEDEKPDVVDRRLRLQRVVRRAGGARQVQEGPGQVRPARRPPPSTTARPPRSSSCSRRSPHEDLRRPAQVTDGKANNENIELYTEAMAEVAEGPQGRRLRRPVHARRKALDGEGLASP